MFQTGWAKIGHAVHRLSDVAHLQLQDAFVALLRSFNAAHNLILEENGMLTTLTSILVLPLAAPRRYVACACNVGDSLAYVYSHKYGVREITQGKFQDENLIFMAEKF